VVCSTFVMLSYRIIVVDFETPHNSGTAETCFINKVKFDKHYSHQGEPYKHRYV
jgi:hypothetical protein